MIGRTETIPFAGCRSSDRTPPPSSTPENSFWAAGVESRTRRQTIRYRRLATQRRLLLASSAERQSLASITSHGQPTTNPTAARLDPLRLCFGVHMGPQLFVRAPSPGLAHRFRLACDEDRHGGNHDDVGRERDQRRGRGMTQAREDQRQVEVGRAFSRCDEEVVVRSRISISTEAREGHHQVSVEAGWHGKHRIDPSRSAKAASAPASMIVSAGTAGTMSRAGLAKPPYQMLYMPFGR